MHAWMAIYQCAYHLQGQVGVRSKAGCGVVLEVSVVLLERDLDVSSTFIPELPPNAYQQRGYLCVSHTYLVMRVLSVADANGPALGHCGLFICEDDGEVTARDEDVAGGGAVFSIRQQGRLFDGLVVQECTPSHGYNVRAGRLREKMCVGWMVL